MNVMRLVKVKKSRFILLLFLLLALLSTPVTLAQEGTEASGNLTLNASAGFDGYYKGEFWFPVTVTVANDGPAIEGQVRVVVGTPSSGDRLVYNSPIVLPTQSNKRLTLFIHTGQVFGDLDVQLLDDQERLVAETTTNSLNQQSLDTLLYGVVSPDPGELAFLENVTGRQSRAAVAFLEMVDLPEVATAWNAIDVLVFNDVDTGQLTGEQLQTLKDWVSTGGQLVVTGGPGGQKTTTALADMLPVTITGSESVADLPALSNEIGVPFRDPGPYLVTSSSLRNGQLLFHQDGLPLLARQGWGRGTVYFLALDPKLAPLLDWDGSEVLWAEVADTVPIRPPWSDGVQNSYAAGTAVSSLPSLALPSVLQLALFLLVYVVTVGPINYLVLKRLNRRELAWVTIPALVLIFSGVTYFTGFQIKGNDTILNQMSIAYGQVGSEQMRVESLVGLYSPRRRIYDLSFPADTLARPFEQTFGTIGGTGNIDAITRSNNLTINGVRVDVSDVETFIADSYRPMPDIGGQAALNLEGNDVRLDVNLHNRSDIPLQDVTLLLGSHAISVGNVDPGETRSESQVVGVATPGTSTGAVPGGMLAPGAARIRPGSGSPLSSNAAVILGTANYYNDRQAFPRWQLLQAIEGSFSPAATRANTLPDDAVVLVAWSGQQQLEMALDSGNPETLNTTLYLLEIPLTQGLIGGQDVSIPVSMLNWQVLDENGVFEATIQNLYLRGGWIEFEYQPWAQFQSMRVEELAVALEAQDPTQTQAAPQVRLWNWQQESWVTVEDAGWGQTAVTDPAPFIGPDNAVRLRLQDNSQSGADIKEVYPVLTGDVE